MTKISKISYLGNLRTAGTHLNSGEQIITDAPVDNNGKGEAFSPTDLVSTALGNCMITLMGITANAHQFELGNIEAEIFKVMENNPRRISQIEVILKIQNMGFSEKQKQLLERAAINCPVAKSLSAEITQSVHFEYTS